MRYYPYGETRLGEMGTDRRYTGQRWESSVGLYDYNARYYDPVIGRFIQADTIVPNMATPQLHNRYTYAANNPILYNDPDGHCGPLCLIGIGLGLAGMALTLTASTPLPPEEQPSAIQGIVGWGLISVGLGLQIPEWLVPIACADGDCGNEVRGVVESFQPSNASALDQFGRQVSGIQTERGLQSFGETWRVWGQMASQNADIADDLFVFRVGDNVAGAMKVANGVDALKITHIEWLGGGAGTELIQTAVRESMTRGFDGRIILQASIQATGFYEKLGFVLVTPATNEYLLTAEAASRLLQQ